MTAKPFVITKTASGGYRWFSTSSNNALDLDKEIVMGQALEDDVTRTKAEGDTSELWLAHIPYRIGGAPDWRSVIDGVLVETGEIDETPVAKAVARFIEAHPDGIDGTGWGVSISWPGYRSQVYSQVRVKERSVLPLSQAANPYTAFNTKEIQKMALNAEQRALLDLLKADPEARDAATTIMAAVETSKALNEAGVQRKSVTETVTETLTTPAVEKDVTYSASTQYVSGPNGLMNEPGTGKAASTCATCGHSKAAHADGACSASGCDCGGFSMGKALSVLTDDDMAGIVMFVEEAVEKRVQAKADALASEVNAALEALVKQNNDLTAEIEKMRDTEEEIYKTNVEPRGVSQYNRLKAFSATASETTQLAEGDPLASKKPSDVSNNTFAQFGLA